MQTSAPNLFDYLHVTSYLEDYVRFRKFQDPKFSYETWSKELGFRSRSYLRMLTIGKKRMTHTFTQAFCRSAGLSDGEKEYFLLLVQYSQVKTQAERQIAGRKLISELLQKTQVGEVAEHFEFFSDPALPRLLTLLSFEDITPTVKRLSLLLRKPVERTQELLEILLKLDLAVGHVVDGEMHWKAKNRIFKVGKKLGDVSLMQFHESSLKDAIEAFKMPHELRRYRSLLVPMNKEEYALFLEMLNDFASEVIAKFNSDQFQGRNLFQVNLNVFSLTPHEPLEEMP